MFKSYRYYGEGMSGRENLAARLSYRGGSRQHNRMVADKENSLRRVLLSSYQSSTLVTPDGREFLCLINPSKLKEDYDDKILSVPFRDICLNGLRMGKMSEGMETVGLKAGDVIQWKETKSYWIISLQHIEEYAYFRASIRRCRYEIDIDGTPYKVYVRGPVEETIDWRTRKEYVYNNLNYTLMMTVTANEQTLDFFHRFTKLKFRGNNYEVQAIDSISTEGVINVYLKEYFNNSIEDAVKEEQAQLPPVEIVEPNEDEPQILGDCQVYPYDIKEFSIKNANHGEWKINNKKAKILEQTTSMIKLQIISGKSGNLILSYEQDNEVVASLSIDILSL